MNITVRDIQRMAAKRFPFDQEHYPDIPKDKEKADLFARKHLLVHMNKNLGEIAAAIEPGDHGQEGPHITPQVLRKLLVNTIRLADMSGVSMQDIQASLDNWSKGLER
jgi:hypothetical protein